MKKSINVKDQTLTLGKYMEGRVLPPLILWMLGVPGGVVIILWLFFFRD
jgi:hypothetical protein